MDEIAIIGGPNGAGKTAQLLVPQGLEIREFVNADEIARGLSPFNPENAALVAGRLMLERIFLSIFDQSRRLASGNPAASVNRLFTFEPSTSTYLTNRTRTRACEV
jgi:hypothetical protein